MNRASTKVAGWVLLAVLCAVIAGCGGVAIPPTYTQAELGAICLRHGGVWHPDTLMGGFCEYQSASLIQSP